MTASRAHRSAPSPASRRIITAARRHYLQRGFRSVTMDELSEELGMSKKTLYAEFPSKTALVEAVLRDKITSVEADLEQITAHDEREFDATLQQLLLCLQQHTAEIHPSFLRDLQRDAPELFEMIQERRSRLIQNYFGSVLASGRKAGIIRKDIPPELMLEILLGATQAIMNPGKILALQLTPKAAMSAIMSVFLRGVVTDKARSAS